MLGPTVMNYIESLPSVNKVVRRPKKQQSNKQTNSRCPFRQCSIIGAKKYRGQEDVGVTGRWEHVIHNLPGPSSVVSRVSTVDDVYSTLVGIRNNGGPSIWATGSLCYTVSKKNKDWAAAGRGNHANVGCPEDGTSSIFKASFLYFAELYWKQTNKIS